MPGTRSGLELAGAFGLVWLALVVPDTVARMDPAALLRLPLELPVILLLLAILPRPILRIVRPLSALILLVSLSLRLADMAAYEAFGRPFNPVLDRHLFAAGWNVLSGSFGTVPAAIGIFVLIALLLATFAGLAVALGRIEQGLRTVTGASFAAAAGVLLIGLKAFGATGYGGGELVTREASHSLADHAQTAIASLRDRPVFAAELRVDPVTGLANRPLFSGLAGKDVLLVFVESYGRSAIDADCCKARTAEALARFETRLDAAGYSARTGYLTSPIVGGQSWLAHATALSGLRIDSQQRYEQFLASDRATLIGDFGASGWRTVAAMPAITMNWPEGRRLGYDAIYDSGALGYRGKPFNWVTMPDQYTLSALDRLELAKPKPRAPVMAEIALISSHAPWTPIPEVIDWAAVGDGSGVFDAMATGGATPKAVWSDPARVREQFSRSIAYALDTLSSFLGLQGNRDLVLIVLGDHQPAPIVTGPNAGRDVPVHLIARDPAVVEAMAMRGWRKGMSPVSGTPSLPMQDLRLMLVDAFTPRV